MRSLAAPLLVVTLGVGVMGLANGCGGDDSAHATDNGDDGGPSTTEGGGGGGGEGGGGGNPDGGSPFNPDGGGVVVLPDGGVLTCGGSAADPAAAATVDGYIGKLSNGPPAGALRASVVDAILRSCEMFGTPTATAGWKPNYCWAQLAASIGTESGYMQNVAVKDSYATRQVSGMTANDPTVGLLQIRFSSTVHEMATLGAVNRLACIGCPLPASVLAAASNDQVYWAVTGPTANMSVMTNVACNVGMGAWYYYENATGNGRASKVTYTNEYCAGGGTGADIITGLMSHLLGDEGGKGVQVANDAQLLALKTSNAGAYGYVNTIKGNVDKMLGPVSGTHPFYMLMAPNPPAYCK